MLFEDLVNTGIKKRSITLTFLCLITLICFFPTFQNELMTGWDDQWQVVNIHTSAGWTWSNLKDIFCYSDHGQYSPLNQCMYMLIYQIFGYKAIGYHAVCLLLHLINICLVYVLLRRILEDTTAISISRISWMAFLTTLIFAIHPLQVESVAWVSASKIPLNSLFYLLATYTFILYLHTKTVFLSNQRKESLNTHNRSKHSKPYYLLTIFLFTCAYASKEQAVSFPLWLLLLCSFYKYDFRMRKVWRILGPFFILALLFGLFYVLETKNTTWLDSNTHNNVVSYTWWQRIVFSCYAIIEYIWKWLFPYKLLYKYFYPMLPGEPLPSWLLLYPFIVVTLVLTLWNFLKRPHIMAGLFFFLIQILLVLHIIPIDRQSIVADRYMYLPLIGLSYIGVYVLTGVYSHFRLSLRRMTVCISVGIISLLCIHTYHRTQRWHDTNILQQEIFQISKEKSLNKDRDSY